MSSIAIPAPESLNLPLSWTFDNFHTLQDTWSTTSRATLLEGANAYTCEKCNRKVDTIKSGCASNSCLADFEPITG
ncbi:hypothetical protein BV898_04408 [Hypsibius exemplaris]|uniref:Uncharacterized protein n=1 Tax=Hypsibius exemplaris TaxID=2072580 RepID=A0A1W0X210_HYPEX|nr:hypothetical protein BV898_04408 [Hypsibius exemplaris]